MLPLDVLIPSVAMLALAILLAAQVPSLPQRQLVEVFRIEETGTPEPWVMIGAVTRLRSGDLVIPDYGVGGAFRFDSAGRPKGRIGRTGDGPGEFRLAAWLGARGDSLWIYDSRSRRLSLFGPEGRFIRAVSLPIYGLGVVPVRTGSFLWISARAYGRPEAVHDPMRIVRYSAAGIARDTLFSEVVPYRQFRLIQGEGMTVGAQVLDDATMITLLDDGSGWLRVERRTEGAAEIGVTRYGTDGRARWRRQIPYQPRPVPRTIVDSLVRSWTHAPGSGTPLFPEDQVRAALFIPSRLPPISSAGMAADGRIWLKRELGSGRMLVLNGETGAALFEVQLPAGARFAGAEGTRVWVVAKDADDVESVVQYRMQ
jgi:hypothetical protein